MYCTDLIHTCQSKTFTSCTETKIAQSLQLLGYVVYNRGPRVQFRPYHRHFYTTSRYFYSPPSLLPIRTGARSLGVNRPGLQDYSYIIQGLGCKMCGATPTLDHMAWCLINGRKFIADYL
jgi:hypothetical protein